MYNYDGLECDECIGESVRPFGERLKEHLWALSPLYYHANTINSSNQVGHLHSGKEAHNIKRTIKEVKYIKVNDLSINGTLSKFHLSYIWNEVLFNTPALHLK